MPIIAFECETCLHEFEHIILSAEKASTIAKAKCPKCGCYAPRLDVVRTGAPLLKPGCGGFFKPSSD